jgi:hypothetical protein
VLNGADTEATEILYFEDLETLLVNAERQYQHCSVTQFLIYHNTGNQNYDYYPYT